MTPEEALRLVKEALNEAQAAFAALIAPEAIRQTTVANTWTTCVAAEAKARAALAALPVLEVAVTWHPGLPPDGPEIVLVATDDDVETAYWSFGPLNSMELLDARGEELDQSTVRCWHPLPAPPALSPAGERHG